MHMGNGISTATERECIGPATPIKGRIVVITGSPRMEGNCSLMADSFISAAKRQGFIVHRFDAAFMEAHGCRHCDRCYTRGTPCVFSDGFNELADEVERADGVLICAPVYWYALPSHIKAIIDRFYAFVHAGKDISGKRCALISSCFEDDLTVFDAVRIQYERTAGFLGWVNVGEVLAPGLDGLSSVNGTEWIDRASELASRFRTMGS